MLGIGVGAYVLWRLREVLFLMFVAVLLATAIEPLVLRLRRGPFNRATGVLIVFGAIVLAIALPSYFLHPDRPGPAAAVRGRLPGAARDASPIRRRAPADAALGGAERDRLRRAGLSARPSRPRDEELVAAGASALESALAVLTVLVLAFYWLLERGAIRKRLAEAAPENKRSVYTIWWEIEEKLGGWVRGQLMLMGTVGALAGVGYLLIGLPSALVLALIAALGELVPVVGPLIAFAPAILAGLTVSPTTALIVLVFTACCSRSRATCWCRA